MQEFHELGHLEMIAGPMFSGKSEELIRRLKRVQISGKEFLLFKPVIDDRYAVDYVVSHDKSQLKAIPIGTDRQSLEELNEQIQNSPQFIEVIAFDEANFFDDCIVDLVDKWISQGRRVIAAGLDTNFRGEPFGPMGALLAKADYVDKLKAICMSCKKRPATMTQRIVNGRPAHYSEPVVVVGASDKYEARCKKCHVVRRD